MQNGDSQTIVRRFFEALDTVIAQGKIRGKQTFTRAHGINRWNMITVSRNPASDMFQTAWLEYLVKDFGVSPMWLLTGDGAMFLENPKISADSPMLRPKYVRRKEKGAAQ